MTTFHDAAAEEQTAAGAHRRSTGGKAGILPGLLLAGAIAAAATALHDIPGIGTLSPLILAIILGMAFHNLIGTPVRAKPGVKFSQQRILRLAIILLGFQLTFEQVMVVGPTGFAVIAITLVSTFVFTTLLGRLMGVEAKLTQLIAAGTSICGASAVIATNTVTQAPDEDAAYAVACATVFGSIAMFAYPLLPGLLHLDPHAFGLWSGASIHEIAQVVAAAFQGGEKAGEFGTIAKLSRVILLAPTIITLGLLAARQARAGGGHHSKAKAPMPWFVLGFIALIGFNSMISMPESLRHDIVAVTTFLLTMALAAMGLETDFGKLKQKGLQPLLLAFIASLFIAGFSLLLVKLTT
jgi:uncharacterized integral membrane protein (TIGR00698 family)